MLGAGAALAVTPLAEHVGFALMTAFGSWLCGLSASGALGGRAFGSAFPSLGVFSWNFVRPLPLLKCWIATACVPVNVFFGFCFFFPFYFYFYFYFAKEMIESDLPSMMSGLIRSSGHSQHAAQEYR